MATGSNRRGCTPGKGKPWPDPGTASAVAKSRREDASRQDNRRGGDGALRRLIADGVITEGALRSITGIGHDALRYFVYNGHSETGLTTTQRAVAAEESSRLPILAAQLTDGMATPGDERLKAILESLTVQFDLTPENIAQLTGLDAGDVDKALSDPRSISFQQRYELATRTSDLIKAFNSAGKR